MTAVWDSSRAKGSGLLLLLAIADFADDAGAAFPSVATLAAKTRLSERSMHYLIKAAKASGELRVEEGSGPRGCNLYKIVLAVDCTPAKNAPVQRMQGAAERQGGCNPASEGVQSSVEKVRQIAPDPSVDPSIDPLGDPSIAAPAPETSEEQQPKGAEDRRETPIALPKKTTLTEEWIAEERDVFAERLSRAAFDEAVSFVMNSDYFRKKPDRRAYMHSQLERAAARAAERNSNGRYHADASGNASRPGVFAGYR